MRNHSFRGANLQYVASPTSLGNLSDVTIAANTNLDLLQYSSTASKWIDIVLLDQDDMSSNSATQPATQQSIKAYVDAQIATEDTIAELNDTTISGPAANDVLQYSGSAWVDRTYAEAGLVSLTGSETLTNKTLTSPTINGGALTALTDLDMTVGNKTVFDTIGANTLTIGASGTTVTIPGSLTVSGTTTTVSTTNTLIADKLITLNDGGSASSGTGVGIEVEEDSSATGYFKTAADRAGWELKAPSTAGVLSIDPSGNSNTITFGGSGKTFTISETATIDQNLATTASVTFADLTVSGTSTTVGTVTSGVWEGTTVAVAQGGTGATTLNNLITLGTHTTGNYAATITGGTGITSSGATSGEGIAHSLSVDASQTQITAVGTIATGTWEGTDVGVAYGGTGVSTLAANSLLTGNGTSAIVAEANLTFDGTDLTLADSKTLALGTGSDSQIYYDGTDTFWNLRDTGTGDLMIALAGSYPSPDPDVVHIWNGSAGSVAAPTFQDGLVIESDRATGITFLTPNNVNPSIFFGDPQSNVAGQIRYNHSTPGFEIDVEATDMIKIGASTFDFQQATEISTSTGNLTIGAATGADVLIGDNSTILYVDGGVHGGVGGVGIGTAANANIFFFVEQPAITATADTPFSRMAISNANALTVPSGTAAYVASLNIAEPNITATGTVTQASTLRIAGAPSEGSTNYALLVDSGVSRFDGDILLDGDLDFTGTQAITTTAGALTLTPTTDVLVSNGKGLVVGHTAQITGGEATSEFQVLGDGFNQASFILGRFSANQSPPTIIGVKSRNATVGGNTIVADDDVVLRIVGAAADGSDFQSRVADIKFQIDGTPGSNDTPGRIVFSTTADGAATETARMQILSTGNIDLLDNDLLNVGAAGSDWDTTSLRNAGDYFGANGKGMVIGHTAKLTVGTLVPEFQVLGSSTTDANIAIGKFSADAVGGILSFAKSKNATVGSHTALADDDVIGYINFVVSNGSNFNGTAASIVGEAAGTTAVNDYPGRLIFKTTPDGAINLVERMRIDSAGNVGIGTGAATPSTPVSVLELYSPTYQTVPTLTMTVADNSIIAGDGLANINFRGTDTDASGGTGHAVARTGATIRAVADDTWGTDVDDNPTRLEFRTQTNGNTDGMATRMQIKSTGEIDLQSNALGLTNVGASGNDWDATGLQAHGSDLIFTATAATGTNVHYVGGNALQSEMTDGQTFTFSMGNGGLFTVTDAYTRFAGVFAFSYASSTMVEIMDTDSQFEITDTGSEMAVFTTTNSHTVTVKNRSGATRTIRVYAHGDVYAATAIA